ncbi:MAG: universal stress protein [Thaumarchaeota archaeon]|nr:universal stress protein [Nitrososphaerota archaeon]
MADQGRFGRILVPTDGSKYSRKALSHAMGLAKMLGSSIHIIMVVDPGEFPPGMLLGLLKEDGMVQESMSKFMSLVKTRARREVMAESSICKSERIDVTCDILSGKPAEMILKYARGKKVGLIVIGSTGLRGLGRLKALGSVSRRVSELAPCPVMVVH